MSRLNNLSDQVHVQDLSILNLVESTTEVGRTFELGEMFVPKMMLAACAMLAELTISGNL